MAPSYQSMTTSSGAFLDSTDVLDVVLTPQKAPDKVVTDGYEGAIYVRAVWSEMTSFIFFMTVMYLQPRNPQQV